MKKPQLINFNQQASSIGRTFKNLEAFRSPEAWNRWSGSAIHDRLFLAFLGLWFLPIIFSAGYILLNFNRLPIFIPLFYSRIWGDLQLARKIFIFIPVIGVFLLGIFDLGVAVSFHSKDKVISYLLSGTAALISLLAAITVFNIVQLMD